MTSDWLPLVVPPLGVFVGGFITGYLVAVWVTNSSTETLKRALAMLITFIWLLSILAGIAIPTYRSPLALHGIMGAAAGFLFGDVHSVQMLMDVFAAGVRERRENENEK